MTKKNELKADVQINVRFSEVDALRVVWHGNYLKYLEDGREAFGKKHGLGYLDVFEQGFYTPIVEIKIKYKKVIRYNDTVFVETRFINTEAAKIVFHYTVFCEKTQDVIATAESVQVFTTLAGELLLTNPPFYTEWKEKCGLTI